MWMFFPVFFALPILRTMRTHCTASFSASSSGPLTCSSKVAQFSVLKLQSSLTYWYTPLFFFVKDTFSVLLQVVMNSKILSHQFNSHCLQCPEFCCLFVFWSTASQLFFLKKNFFSLAVLTKPLVDFWPSWSDSCHFSSQSTFVYVAQNERSCDWWVRIWAFFKT